MSQSNDPELDFYQNYLRKELFDKVREDSLIFEFIQEGVLDGIWYWDLVEPENEWMSPKFWQTFGYDPHSKKHLATEWQDMIFEEDLKRSMDNLNKHLADPTYPYDQIVRYKHKDGSTVWVRCRGLAIHDEHGKPVRMIGAHTDVTPMMTKQQQLVREQFQATELAAMTAKSESLLKVEKLVTESLLHQVNSLSFTDTQTGLWHKHAALHELEKQFEIAQRTDLRCNYALLKLQNIKPIRDSFGAIEVVNKFSETNQLIGKSWPNLMLSHFHEDIILIAQVGYPDDAFSQLCEDLISRLEQAKWSIITPIWQLTQKSVIPDKLGPDVEQEPFFKNWFEQQYIELTQKLL